MPIGRVSFGLVTQLLDLTAESLSSSVPPPGTGLALPRGEGIAGDTGGSEETADVIRTPAGPRDAGWQAAEEPAGNSREGSWAPVLELVRAVGVGAVAEEVALGNEETIDRFLELQREATAQGIETFLRLQELTDEALEILREVAAEAAAGLEPGEKGPAGLRLMVDLGQPEGEDLARWLPPSSSEEWNQPGGEEFEDRPGGSWSQALAFSLFEEDPDTAMRRLERLAAPLLDTAERPGVEQPVWLAAFSVGDRGAAASPAGVVKVAAHALSLGIERVFLAAGPDEGWWPADLRSPPPPLQAFRTLAGCLDGAAGITRIAAGQYRIDISARPSRYLLWRAGGASRIPDNLRGNLQIMTPLGQTRRVESERFLLTDEPVFVDSPP